jgi:hypothetical protein
LQDPAKFTQIGIFGLKIYYLATICHTTEKSEAIVLCKEMPLIPFYKVLVKERIIGNGG